MSLQRIATLDLASRAAAYESLVDELVGCGDVPALNELADALTDDSTPATVARGPLKRLGDALARVSDNSDVITIATRTLERLALRNGGAIGAAGFDEADYALRLPLYAVYMGEDDPLRAATVLSAARLEGAAFTDAQRAAGYIKVAQAYLRADDDVNADRFVKRATDPVYRTGDAVMALTLKALTAVVLDAKRRFLEAAVRYLEVVAAGSALVEEVELLKFLQDAATAAILAPAGPQRLRVLGAVLRDSRVTSLDAAVAGMLKHVATGRLIAPDDAVKFATGLKPHQRVKTADGTTIVARAIEEHNVLATSKLFSSISFVALGRLLGVSPERAETLAGKMIAEKRLVATLDGVGGFVDFVGPVLDSAVGGRSSVERLHSWDVLIKDVCAAVTTAVEAVQR